MRSRLHLYVALLLAIFSTIAIFNIHGALNQIPFQTTWGGTGNDVAQAVAIGPSGSIYITGFTSNSFSSGTHVFLLKLSKSGSILWQKMWSGVGSEYGEGVGVDSQDNIFVVGYTGSFGSGGNDVFLLKWNSSGNLLWQKTWGGTGDDLGFGLAINGTDSVYVTGRSYTLGNPKAILLKFDTAGNLLWQRAWGGTGGDYGQSVAVDSLGGIYVTGYTSSAGAGGQDAFILKFDPTGKLIWQETWGGTVDDAGNSITVDSSSNVYVTGATQSSGVGAGAENAFILKLKSSGALLWERTWGGTNVDQGQGVAVDGLGYVYVTGGTNSFGGSAEHVFLLSIDPAGHLLWQTLWGSMSGSDYGNGVAAAGSGYVVTTGIVSEVGPYNVSSVSGSYATPIFDVAAAKLSTSTPNLGTASSSGIVLSLNGGTSYGGRQDAFIFEYGAPTPPTPPIGVRAIGRQGFVNLTWNTPAFNGFNAISGYKIYRSTAPGKEVLLTSLGVQTQYTDLNIAGGVTYYYLVTALNSIGESLPSNETASIPYPTTPPTNPQNLGATGTTGQVTLNWSPPSSNGGVSITGYKLYKSTSTGNETLFATLAVQTSYVDTNVVGGTTYYYTVTALNGIGESKPSNEASGLPLSAPTPPQNLQAITSLGKIILSWSAPASNGGSPLTQYKVFRGLSSGGESLLATLIAPQLSYTDSRVNTSITYYYEVTASNLIGDSGPSNEVSATPSSTPSVPTAPQSLIATAGTMNVTLTWNSPLSNGGSSITAYTVYRGEAPNTLLRLTGLGNQTYYIDMVVSVGTTYYYRVSATNGVGESPQSNEASATPFTRPSSPQNLQAFSGLNSAILSWNPPSSNGESSITGYRIYRNASFLAAIGNRTFYVDSSVLDGLTYIYNVSAVNAAGEGPHSTEASAVPSSVPVVPSPPVGLSATPGNGTVTLTWSPPLSNGGSAITGYQIWRGLASGAEAMLSPAGNVTTYIDNAVQGGTPYFYFVKANNTAGLSARSNEVSAIPTSPPSSPQNLAATPGVNTILLSWSTPSRNGGLAIMGYKIYRGTSSGTLTLLTTVNNVNTLTYLDSGVTSGQTYYYRVTTFNSLGESAFSNEVNATPSSPPPPVKPGPPTSVAATPGNNNITLTWIPPANNGGAAITGYQIWRGTSASGETLYASIGDMTRYVDTSVSSGTTYYYYVKAVNSAGASDPSSEVSASPLAPSTPPNQPTNLKASITASGLVNLTWDVPAASSSATPITGYNIYRGTSSGGEGTTPYAVTNNVTSYLDRSATAGTTYYYRITAVNSVGESGYSNEAIIAVPSPPAAFPIIPVAIAALVIVAVGALGVIFWRRRVSQRLMMPP